MRPRHGSGDAPAGGRIVSGGWEHEHCRICWEKIGQGGAPTGFLSEDDEWACTRCYQEYVLPKSVGFVMPGQ